MSKLSVEEIKAIRETFSLVPLGSIYILCNTALELAEENEKLKNNLSAVSALLKITSDIRIAVEAFTENKKLKAENARLSRYERAWKLSIESISLAQEIWIKKQCGIEEEK